MQKIGIYGGTFDPIHHGHLILARAAAELLELQRVIFVPAAASPHKGARVLAPADARREMIEAAIAGEPLFSADDLELKRPPPSFTIDTVEAFAARTPGARLFLLVGEDNVAQLETWRRFSELRQMAEIVILGRSGFRDEHPYRCVPRHIDISATEIRNRVALGVSIRYLVPAAVDDIIRRQQLYLEPAK